MEYLNIEYEYEPEEVCPITHFYDTRKHIIQFELTSNYYPSTIHTIYDRDHYKDVYKRSYSKLEYTLVEKKLVEFKERSFDGFLKFLSDLDLKDYNNGVSFNKPIFIGGCARSGTTLLSSILSVSDELVVEPVESYAFSLKPFRPYMLRRCSSVNSTGTRLCEKTPMNVHMFNDIYEEFNRDAILLHVIRDGRDVCTSFHPKHIGYYVSPQRWYEDTVAGLQCPHAYTVKYEDLVTDPLTQIKRICEIASITFTPQMLRPEVYAKKKEDVSFSESLGKLTCVNIGRWKMERHKERLKEFMQHEKAVNLLRALSYDE